MLQQASATPTSYPKEHESRFALPSEVAPEVLGIRQSDLDVPHPEEGREHKVQRVFVEGLHVVRGLRDILPCGPDEHLFGQGFELVGRHDREGDVNLLGLGFGHLAVLGEEHACLLVVEALALVLVAMTVVVEGRAFEVFGDFLLEEAFEVHARWPYTGVKQGMTPHEQALTNLGVEIEFEHDYKLGKTNEEVVKSVWLPFSPEEWVSIAMRDQPDYMGGCCGTTSVMQDIVCGAFRDEGRLDVRDMKKLAYLAESHPDGFEDDWHTYSDEEFQKAISSWADLRPWAKMGVIVHTVLPKLQPTFPADDEKPELDDDKPEFKEKDCVRLVGDSLQLLRYEDLYAKAPEDQDHANRMLLLSRLIPAMKMLLGMLAREHKPFEGFAIVEQRQPGVVLRNGYGLCLYKTEDEANKIVRREHEKDTGAALLRIRPVRVTVEDGFTFKG